MLKYVKILTTVFLFCSSVLIFNMGFSLEPSSEAGLQRPSVEFTADRARDPFRSYIQEEKQKPIEIKTGTEVPAFNAPALTVEGVVWGSAVTTCAIINGKVVKAGDVIEGAKVLEIKKEGIKLFYQGWKYTLPSPANPGLEEKPEYQGGLNE